MGAYSEDSRDRSWSGFERDFSISREESLPDFAAQHSPGRWNPPGEWTGRDHVAFQAPPVHPAPPVRPAAPVHQVPPHQSVPLVSVPLRTRSRRRKSRQGGIGRFLLITLAITMGMLLISLILAVLIKLAYPGKIYLVSLVMCV